MIKTDTRTCRRCGWTHKGSEDMCSKCKRYVEKKELKLQMKKIKEEYLLLIRSIKGWIEPGKTGKLRCKDIYNSVKEDIKKLYILDIEGGLRYEDGIIAGEIWGIEAGYLMLIKNARNIF